VKTSQYQALSDGTPPAVEVSVSRTSRGVDSNGSPKAAKESRVAASGHSESQGQGEIWRVRGTDAGNNSSQSCETTIGEPRAKADGPT
jgi:hypothetical protein